MAPRTRLRQASDDSVVCHRAGYASLTPQACLEKHVRNEEACGSCRAHHLASMVMADTMSVDIQTVCLQAQEGSLTRHSNPLVSAESCPEHQVVLNDQLKRSLHMNTRIVYVNGRRLPQGMVLDFRHTGGLTERRLFIRFDAELLAQLKLDPHDIAVDEIVNGRYQTRYEWNNRDDKAYGKPVDGTVDVKGKQVTTRGYQMPVATADNFQMG